VAESNKPSNGLDSKMEILSRRTGLHVGGEARASWRKRLCHDPGGQVGRPCNELLSVAVALCGAHVFTLYEPR
jgi:hypothetical protein